MLFITVSCRLSCQDKKSVHIIVIIIVISGLVWNGFARHKSVNSINVDNFACLCLSSAHRHSVFFSGRVVQRDFLLRGARWTFVSFLGLLSSP